jgi:hypothetical protein
MTPPALDRVVKTCLAKDPDDRWQTAGDLRRELKWIAEGGPQSGISSVTSQAAVSAAIPSTAAPAHKSTNWIAWASVAAVVVAALVAGAIYFRPAPAGNAPVQFTVGPPEKGRFGDQVRFQSVSPVEPSWLSLLWMTPASRGFGFAPWIRQRLSRWRGRKMAMLRFGRRTAGSWDSQMGI